MLNKLCMPALIYLVYSFTHVLIDTSKGLYNTAMVEIVIGITFTLVLNIMCDQGLGIISWVIISLPFILMSSIAALVLFGFGLNPATGQSLSGKPTPNHPDPTPSEPSRYAYPISVNVTPYYGSLGNSNPPVPTQ
jgi:hypothetical protein